MKRSNINRKTQLKPFSAKRALQSQQRKLVRQIVCERADNQCEYADVIPEISCGMLPGRGMEVDELRGGSYRQQEWLDPDRCKLTCPVHHDFKTDNKKFVLRRLGEEGYC